MINLEGKVWEWEGLDDSWRRDADISFTLVSVLGGNLAMDLQIRIRMRIRIGSLTLT